MVLRVNMTKKSMSEFIQISNFFKERYCDNQNIVVYPAFLKNINNKTSEFRACDYCTADDKVLFAKNMFYATKDKHILYPSNDFNECAIRNHNSWAFGPDGSVYKCWENIGVANNELGFIDDNGHIQITNKIMLAQYLYGADPLYDENCSECEYLPICFGRCPHERIQSMLGFSKLEPCAKGTDYLRDYLTTLIDELY